MENNNLNPLTPREEPELITDVVGKSPVSQDTASAQANAQTPEEAVAARDEAWLEEFFRDFSLPEEELAQDPAPKEPILKDRWETSPIPTVQAAEAAEAAEEAELDESKEFTRPAKDKSRGLWGMITSLPHLASALIWLTLVVIIGVSLGRTLWTAVSDLMAFGKEDQSITITITEKEVKRAPDGTLIFVDIEAIAEKLAAAGLVDHPDLFVTFATMTGKDKDIAAGTYTLNSYFDYNAIINGISYHAPIREVVTVMIPEGYTCAQIYRLLEENGVCSVTDLEKYVAEGEIEDYWFLEGVTRGTKYCLEGFLFPDTYDFYVDDDPGRVIGKFLSNFNYRFSDSMREDFVDMQQRYAQMLASHGYGSDYIASHPLTIHQLMTLASIVEKESANGAESFDIASVYYNRLTNQKEYPYLDADATVHYAIGDYYGEVKELTQAQLATNSPYNTRGVQKGLPPGPIANPGAYSLYAVLGPNDTNYHYYLLDPKAGTHKFAATYNAFLQLRKELGYS